MKKEKREFCRRVITTTAVSFLLITFGFFGLFTLMKEELIREPFYVFCGYMLGKLFCVLLFSLSLGFLNRLMEVKKVPAPLLRLAHFAGAAVSFSVFMILLFNIIHLGENDASSLNVRNVLMNYVLFVALYFISVGVAALGRKIFLPKEEKEYKDLFK